MDRLSLLAGRRGSRAPLRLGRHHGPGPPPHFRADDSLLLRFQRIEIVLPTAEPAGDWARMSCSEQAETDVPPRPSTLHGEGNARCPAPKLPAAEHRKLADDPARIYLASSPAGPTLHAMKLNLPSPRERHPRPDAGCCFSRSSSSRSGSSWTCSRRGQLPTRQHGRGRASTGCSRSRAPCSGTGALVRLNSVGGRSRARPRSGSRGPFRVAFTL